MATPNKDSQLPFDTEQAQHLAAQALTALQTAKTALEQLRDTLDMDLNKSSGLPEGTVRAIVETRKFCYDLLLI